MIVNSADPESLKLENSTFVASEVFAAMSAAAKELGITGAMAIAMGEMFLDSLTGLTQEEIEEIFELGLAGMMARTESENTPGFLSILNKLAGRWSRVGRESEEWEKVTNYLAFVTGKVQQSLRTGQNSSGDPKGEKRRGESAARGARYRHRIITAFSGGTEDQDEVVAEAGQQRYEELRTQRFFNVYSRIIRSLENLKEHGDEHQRLSRLQLLQVIEFATNKLESFVDGDVIKQANQEGKVSNSWWKTDEFSLQQIGFFGPDYLGQEDYVYFKLPDRSTVTLKLIEGWEESREEIRNWSLVVYLARYLLQAPEFIELKSVARDAWFSGVNLQAHKVWLDGAIQKS